MKRIIAIVLVLTLAFILVGCNVASNLPGVTPYGANDNGWDGNGWNDNDNNNNGGTANDNDNRIDTNDALNTKEFYGERRNVNSTDKALLQGR
jgi:hypothetical protein